MLQKLKLTSYAFIYFLLFGFSFIALQVTTEEVEAAGVCEPIAGIKNLKGTPRDKDYKLWVSRCQISGQNGNCGDAATHWPQGDSGRCETTTADTVAAQDVHSTVAPVNVADQNNSGAVCHPSDGIIERYNTELHESYEYSVGRCAPEGVTADTCATGWGKGRCQWGIPPELEPLKPAIVQKMKDIAYCKTSKAVRFSEWGRAWCHRN